MNITNPNFYKSIRHYFFLVFVLLFSLSVLGQQPAQDSVKTGFNLGKIKAPNPNSVESKYTFDPVTNRYIYTEKIGTYNIKYPVILTPKEYYALVAKENLKAYYKEKIDAFDGKKSGAKDGQKNLIPEFYVKSDFFHLHFWKRYHKCYSARFCRNGFRRTVFKTKQPVIFTKKQK